MILRRQDERLGDRHRLHVLRLGRAVQRELHEVALRQELLQHDAVRRSQRAAAFDLGKELFGRALGRAQREPVLEIDAQRVADADVVGIDLRWSRARRSAKPREFARIVADFVGREAQVTR